VVAEARSRPVELPALVWGQIRASAFDDDGEHRKAPLFPVVGSCATEDDIVLGFWAPENAPDKPMRDHALPGSARLKSGLMLEVVL
jgi:hypothetical protein